MNPFVYSLACLVWGCIGQRLRVAGKDGQNSLVKEFGLRSVEWSRAGAINSFASLLFAAPLRTLREPLSTRRPLLSRAPTPRALIRMAHLHPTRNSKTARVSTRMGKTIMGGWFSVPPMKEAVWIDKNIPTHEERVLYLGETVEDENVNFLIASMIYLDALEHAPIYLYINSPGGSVIAGLKLYDAMQHVQSDVITINLGMAASVASLILGGGVRGKRIGVSSSGIMIHQPASGGVGPDGTLDKRVDADQVSRIKDVIISMYADMTGHSREKIIKDISFDNYMTAKEALDYGLVDEIIENKPSWDLDM